MIQSYSQIFTDANKESPKKCLACGTQVYRFSHQTYGGVSEGCFSSQCVKPYPIGMIRGDVSSFVVEEYGLGVGRPYVKYPEAEGYSPALRDEVKKILTTWGFWR